MLVGSVLVSLVLNGSKNGGGIKGILCFLMKGAQANIRGVGVSIAFCHS